MRVGFPLSSTRSQITRFAATANVGGRAADDILHAATVHQRRATAPITTISIQASGLYLVVLWWLTPTFHKNHLAVNNSAAVLYENHARDEQRRYVYKIHVANTSCLAFVRKCVQYLTIYYLTIKKNRSVRSLRTARRFTIVLSRVAWC